jgi:two-component system sensor histidine kinase KdpD
MPQELPIRRRSARILALSAYVLAFLATLTTTVVLFALREVINAPSITLLFLIPVGISAAYWGLWPGIFSALTAFLCINYFFIKPYYTLLIHQPGDLLMLVVFFGVAFGISQIVGRLKGSVAAAMAREREATRLYELSAKLSGLNEEEIIIQTIARFTLDTFQARSVKVLLHREKPEDLVFVVTSDEHPTPTTASPAPSASVPMQGAQKLHGEIILWREGSPLEEAEERLLNAFATQGVLALERALLLEADTRAKVLEESDRMKSSLLSSVSHELRTPLATIKASVTGLRSGAVPWDSEARIELLAAIDEETDQLNQLVSNLLNMSRIEVGALKPTFQWNILSEIAATPINRARTHLKAHMIEVDIPDDLPLVYVDDILIEQVFTNLLSNSAKYSPENSTIRVMACKKDDQSLWVQVSNQGPHVTENDLGRIFDKFHRVTSADRITGTGLGLSICKGIVEAHRGQIWAENLPDGFAIDFTLPLTWEGVAPRMPVE